MNANTNKNNTLLTLADISRHFDLPESTARYYCKRFAHFLPIHGEGRRRRYGEDTLEVISCVLEFMKTGKNANAVEKELSARFARTTDVYVPAVKESALSNPQQNFYQNPIDGSFALTIIEQQNAAMQSIAQSLNILANQQEQMHELTKAAKEATEENIQLRDEVTRLQSVIRASEAVHQDDLDQVRTWMSRLAKNYNDKTPLDTQAPQKEK